MSDPAAVTAEPGCLFCKIVDGSIPAQVVHRDDAVVAFRDIDPKAPLHVLVVPTRHLPNAAAVAAHDPALVGAMVTTAAGIAAAEGHADSGYRLVLNTGDDGGQTVHHAHLHLLAGRALGWPPG